MVAWAAIIPAIGAVAKAAGGAVATGAKTLGSKVAASKLGSAAATGKNALQSRLMETAIKNIPNGLNSQQTTLANALAAMPKTTTGLTSQPQFTVTPSRVDYSQYIGLSPETQRYLYGGM